LVKPHAIYRNLARSNAMETFNVYIDTVRCFHD
jgi:hypothetical protein